MRSALVPSNIAHDEALEVRDAVPTTLVRWDWAYRTEFPKRCRDPEELLRSHSCRGMTSSG